MGTASADGELTDLSRDSLSSQCKTPTVGLARIWRLSRDQIGSSIKMALGVDVKPAQLAAFNDGTGALFRNETASLSIHKADAESWALSVADLASAALPAMRAAKICPDSAAASCAPTFVDTVGTKLFRRPLTTDQKARYTKVYTDTLAANAGAAGGDAATTAVLSALLQSPYFLYRTELGHAVPDQPRVARLTGYEMASALAYTLWQTAPDTELLRAAGAGELDVQAGVRQQAMRMIGDAQFGGFYAAMLADLTHASHMASREGADIVPNGATIMGGYADEFDRFVRAVMTENPTLEELLTHRQVSLSGDTRQFRNLGSGMGTAPVTVDLPSPIAGLLSLGAVSFANAGTDHPSPVRRGLMVRERLLCSPIPPPPPSVKMQFATGGDIVTNRQKYEKTMGPPDCNSCHRLFNPMGFAFEAFDELGRYRTQDNGQDVNLAGAVVDTRDANVSFTNLTELAQGLAASQQLSECFALQGFRFVSGRFETSGDLCYVDRIHQSFAAGGRSLSSLAVELVASDAFALRTVEN